ncbi:MAG: hypothetical protein IPM85_14715 [Chitinophagaceae bacterium]|nr:hypothetical protein [Chitinophagaceae bacterium]
MPLLPSSYCQTYESWILKVQYEGSLNTGNSKGSVQAIGTAFIEANAEGVFNGTGSMKATEELISDDYNSSCTGSGNFSVTGKRIGKYLIFKFEGLPLILNGYITILGKKHETKSSLSPSICTPSEVSIERKEGGYTNNISSAQTDTKVSIAYTLSGGNNISEEDNDRTIKTPITVSPENQNLWVINIEGTTLFSVNNNSANAKITATGTGKITFPFQKNENKVAGEGEFIIKSSEKWTRPKVLNKKDEIKGTYIMNGIIQNDTLRFTISAKQFISGNLSLRNDNTLFPEPWVLIDTNVVALPFNNNSSLELKKNEDKENGFTYDEKVTFKLQGKKIEKWKIEIDDFHYSLAFNDGTGKKMNRCGSKVHSRRDIEIICENGEFKYGEGNARFVSIDPYVNPPDAFISTVQNEEIIGTGTDVEKNRYQNAMNSKRFNPPLNEEDKALKKEWSNIPKNKTPFIFPEKFSVSGIKKGTTLQIKLPANSGYTLAIVCTPAIKGPKKPTKEIVRKSVDSNFTIQLKDGWEFAFGDPDSIDRTVISVHKLD